MCLSAGLLLLHSQACFLSSALINMLCPLFLRASALARSAVLPFPPVLSFFFCTFSPAAAVFSSEEAAEAFGTTALSTVRKEEKHREEKNEYFTNT